MAFSTSAWRPVALRQVRNLRAGLQHYPGELQTQDVVGAARRRGIAALPLHSIGAVQGRRLDLHQNVIGSRNGIGNLSNPENVRAARLGNNNSAHKFQHLNNN